MTTLLSPPSDLAAQPGLPPGLSARERELAAIVHAYNQVTEQLKQSHDRLNREVVRLREELEGKNQLLRRRERLAALGELAAGMAHEIRNPLAGIQLFASLLERDLQDRPEQVRVVRKIASGVSALEAIVTDILEFGRPRDAAPAQVQLDAILAAVGELALARSKGASLSIESASGLSLCTDPVLLQRALLNLTLNAMDAVAGREDGRVVVQVDSSSRRELVISVRDNGPGIAGEHLDRIFNPFFTTKGSGTGLGLAIVHQIAEALGGSVQATNHAEGGAMFSLRLPRGTGMGPRAAGRR